MFVTRGRRGGRASGKGDTMKKKAIYLSFSVLIWLCVWQYAAGSLDKSVLLPYPKAVFRRFISLLSDPAVAPVWRTSLVHIALGFALALLAGVVLAIACRFGDFLSALLLPPLKLVKTVPVVSFIILLLLWVNPASISIVISFLIVLPVVFENVSRGIRETPESMLAMAKVYRIPWIRRLRALYIPNAVPYATAAVSTGLSLCWKAGIAAEIIGLSKDSIGRQLYDAKLYLDTESLFAWTVLILLISVLMEWAVMVVFRAVAVTLADPAMWYRGTEVLRYILGIRASKTGSAPEGVEEPAPEEPEADEEHVPEIAAEYSPENTAAEPAETVSGNLSESAEEIPTENTACAPVHADRGGDLLLELRGVSKNYNGRAVLSDITLTVSRGEVVLITGPSGSGKTTLLRCLLGLTEPDAGAIVMPGGRPKAAAVFQEDRLCEGLSAWRNVALVLPGRASAHREGIIRELASVGIRDSVKRSVRDFSGGMKRRTAWIRALCAESDLLVLDEPFTGLDRARIGQLLRRLHRDAADKGVVIVTHNASEIDEICSIFENVKRVSVEAGDIG